MGEERRPFWNDPIVIIGSAVPLIILSAIAGYLIGSKRAAAAPSPVAATVAPPGPTVDILPPPSEPKGTVAAAEPGGALLEAYKAAEPARKLAIFDTRRLVLEDDPRVANIRSMLQRAHGIYAQSDEEIVGITGKLVNLLEGEGKPAVGSEILDALTFTMPRPKSGTPKVDYAEMASTYRTLRQPDRTHTEAVALLQQSYELMKKGFVQNFTPEDPQ